MHRLTHAVFRWSGSDELGAVVVLRQIDFLSRSYERKLACTYSDPSLTRSSGNNAETVLKVFQSTCKTSVPKPTADSSNIQARPHMDQSKVSSSIEPFLLFAHTLTLDCVCEGGLPQLAIARTSTSHVLLLEGMHAHRLSTLASATDDSSNQQRHRSATHTHTNPPRHAYLRSALEKQLSSRTFVNCNSIRKTWPSRRSLRTVHRNTLAHRDESSPMQ